MWWLASRTTLPLAMKRILCVSLTACPVLLTVQGSVAQRLDLIQFEFDGRLSAEHRYDNAYLVLFGLELIDNADEACQRAVG